MKNLLLLSICCFLSNLLSAQKDAPISFSLAYFGETVIHSGFKVGIEKPFYTKEKTRKRWFSKRQERLGARVSKYQWIGGANIGTYNHPNNHTGVFLNGEISWRKTKMRKGTMFGFSLGAGYLHQFYNIDTYRLNNGQLQQVNTPGQGLLTSHIAFLIGRDVSIQYNTPLSWYIKSNLIFQTPYNHSGILNTALEIGINYRLLKNEPN